MSRAGVPADIGERVLGHTMEGIRGTYDWHSYTDEKADALQRLANLLGEIAQAGPNLRRNELRRRGGRCRALFSTMHFTD